MNVWLDDLRPEPAGWVRCRTAAEAVTLMLNHADEVDHMSLDHDLGELPLCHDCTWSINGCEAAPDECKCKCHGIAPTGYDFVKWMAENEIWPRHKPMLHTQNPVGRANMKATIDRYFPTDEPNE